MVLGFAVWVRFMWGWYNIVSIWGLGLLAWVLGRGVDFLGFGLWLVLWLGGGWVVVGFRFWVVDLGLWCCRWRWFDGLFVIGGFRLSLVGRLCVVQYNIVPIWV